MWEGTIIKKLASQGELVFARLSFAVACWPNVLQVSSRDRERLLDCRAQSCRLTSHNNRVICRGVALLCIGGTAVLENTREFGFVLPKPYIEGLYS
jgi:hypothetical protein